MSMGPSQRIEVSNEGVRLVNLITEGEVSPFEVVLDSVVAGSVGMHTKFSSAFIELVTKTLAQRDYSPQQQMSLRALRKHIGPA